MGEHGDEPAMTEPVDNTVADGSFADKIARAEQVNTIADLVGGATHDLNNLLTVIMGQAEYLADHDNLSAADKKAAETISNAAGKAAAVTHYLAAYVQKRPLDPEPLWLPDVLDQMSPVLASTLRSNIDLEIDAAAQLWLIEADSWQLERSFLAVLFNAQDAMPEGGSLRIQIDNRTLSEPETEHGFAAGDYVVVTVKDTGAGMTAEVLARAIEPFFTTKAVTGTSGLGLSMVSDVLYDAGGWLSLSSEPGKGTRVEMYFPALPQ